MQITWATDLMSSETDNQSTQCLIYFYVYFWYFNTFITKNKVTLGTQTLSYTLSTRCFVFVAFPAVQRVRAWRGRSAPRRLLLPPGGAEAAAGGRGHVGLPGWARRQLLRQGRPGETCPQFDALCHLFISKYSVCTVWGFTSLHLEVRGQDVLPRGTSAGRRGVCLCRQGSWWFWNWIYVLNFICEQLQSILSLPHVPPEPGFISPAVLSEQESQSLSTSTSFFFFKLRRSFWNEALHFGPGVSDRTRGGGGVGGVGGVGGGRADRVSGILNPTSKVRGLVDWAAAARSSNGDTELNSRMDSVDSVFD